MEIFSYSLGPRYPSPLVFLHTEMIYYGATRRNDYILVLAMLKSPNQHIDAEAPYTSL